MSVGACRAGRLAAMEAALDSLPEFHTALDVWDVLAAHGGVEVTDGAVIVRVVASPYEGLKWRLVPSVYTETSQARYRVWMSWRGVRYTASFAALMWSELRGIVPEGMVPHLPFGSRLVESNLRLRKGSAQCVGCLVWMRKNVDRCQACRDRIKRRKRVAR